MTLPLPPALPAEADAARVELLAHEGRLPARSILVTKLKSRLSNVEQLLFEEPRLRF